MHQDSFIPVKSISWYINKHADSQIMDFACGKCSHVNKGTSFFHAQTSRLSSDEYAVISECSSCNAHNTFWEYGYMLTARVSPTVLMQSPAA